MSELDLINVTAENVSKTGFFCKMSARGKPGYERKRAWLDQRFAEGLRIKLLGNGERGFVEYIPGDHAWRAIENAGDYLFIHCLWVVGKSKGKGFGKALLDHVIATGRAEGFKGVATLASPQHWLTDVTLYQQAGFSSVASDQGFHLMAMDFNAQDTPPTSSAPRFSGSFEQKLANMGPGITVQRSDQCPYLDDAVLAVEKHANALSLPFRVTNLQTADDVRKLSPTPYGVFAIARDGQLVSHCYLTAKDLAQKIAA